MAGGSDRDVGKPFLNRMTDKALAGKSVQEFKSETQHNRDPQDLHGNVKIDFHHIIAEPDGYHSSKYIWNMSETIYHWGKKAAYELVSFFFGVPLALIWGCMFAFVACVHVWIYAPLKSSHTIKMGCWAHFWSIIVKACCDPIFESAGKAMSSVHIHTEKIVV